MLDVEHFSTRRTGEEFMSFGQPLWFWAFALFPVLLGFFIRNEALRSRLLRKLVAARLEDRLAGTVSVGKRRLRFALVLLGMGAIILSLTQPRWGYTWEQSKRKGRDVLIAIDVSKSMLATDLAPNRLTRAKLAAQDFISQLGGDRVGLIAFAGGAFLQAPLTADFNAMLTSLNELDTEIIPRGGSNIAEAIRVAVEAFGKGESDHRALIIFTDGEELDADGIKEAEKVKDSVKIFGVGVGSTEGALIPMPGRGGGTDFVKDDSGQFVKSRLDEARLRKIAELTGGFYVHLRNGPAEMTQIVREGLAKMSEQEIDAKLSRQPIERYQWPLAAGLGLFALSKLIGERRSGAGTRRRALSVLLMGCAFLLTAADGMAAPSPMDLYAGGKYEDAQREWQKLAEKNPKSGVLAFNLGAAAYKNKDLDTALKAFGQALASEDSGLRARAEYNLGNTLFQKGAEKKEIKPLEDALAHYDQALNLIPEDANTLHNKKATEELIAKLKEQQEKQDEQKKDEQKKQDSKDQKDQDKKDQNKDEQQKQDQQKGDSKDDKKDGQSQKDGEKKDGKDGKDGEQKDAGGKQDEKDQKPDGSQDSKDAKDQKPGEKQQGQEGEQGKEGEKKQGAKDGSDVPQPDRKLAGEVKGNPSQSQEGQQPQDAAAEAAAEAQAAIDGTMTERQAKALLDSLKSEDERVRLLEPNERKRNGRVLRDW